MPRISHASGAGELSKQMNVQGTLALYIRYCVSLCLSDDTLKDLGPFYLVSMPGEVKCPTSLNCKCVTCRGPRLTVTVTWCCDLCTYYTMHVWNISINAINQSINQSTLMLTVTSPWSISFSLTIFLALTLNVTLRLTLTITN